MSRWQLSQRLFSTPWRTPRLTHYVEIDVSGLEVLNPEGGKYLIPGISDLNLMGRIVGGGSF